MSPDQIRAVPRLREDRPRTTAKAQRDEAARAVVAAERPQIRKRS